MRTIHVLGCALALALAAPVEGAWTRYSVVDARLSTLRAAPRLPGPLLKRLRVGRQVFEVGRAVDAEGRVWLRVAVTRRTRGWMLAEALARPGDRESEERLAALVDALTGFDRMEVARLAVDRFPRLRAGALEALDEEAARAVPALSERANRRLGPLDGEPPDRVRALMLSDPGLDRFNRLGVTFDVDVATRSYVPRFIRSPRGRRLAW